MEIRKDANIMEDGHIADSKGVYVFVDGAGRNGRSKDDVTSLKRKVPIADGRQEDKVIGANEDVTLKRGTLSMSYD